MQLKALQAHAIISPACIHFLTDKLAAFDLSKLEYIRLYDRLGKSTARGVWGRCTFPNKDKDLGYRIRCSISIVRFPHNVKWAVGTRQLTQSRWEWVWRKDQFHSKEEAFVWITGHEAFHWLRHSRQIPGRNYETQANRFGFSWLDEWRPGVMN